MPLTDNAVGTILSRLGERKPRRWGVGTAAAYVRRMERHATDPEAFKAALERAERQAVYCDDETLIKGHRLKDADDPDPTKPLMVFDATITTTKRDRDGDILESKGARADMDGPLLLNHDYSLIIGKPLKAVKQNSKRYIERLAIVNSPDPKSPLGLLARDVATLIDFGALRRMSHGFMPDENKDADDPAYEAMLGKEDEFLGWHIFRYEIWERSVVAVASNTDAFITAFSRGKLASPMVKSWGRELFDERPVIEAAITIADAVQPEFSKWEIVSLEGPDEGPDADVSAETPDKLGDGGSEAAPEPAPLLDDERSGGAHAVPRVLRFARPMDKSGESTFDVWREHLEPAQLEYDWVSRYIGCQVKHLFWVTTAVPQARVGSWLTGLREVLGEYTVEDTRNIGYDGTEYPPKYEIIQLTPDKTDDFMVDGIEFRAGDRKFAVKFEPYYGMLEVTFYTSNSDADKQFARKVIDDAWEWSRVNNFLRRQAFSLTGGFLSKTGETWDGLFLPQRNKAPVMRAVKTVNEKGASGPNRGMVFAGPPGTGKTLSARVMLNATSCTFIWVSARDFWCCGSYRAFTHAFDLARELAPTIVCFDDVDSWIESRGGTVDLLKSELDGMGRTSGVLTLLISNYPEDIPDALIDRPGRFHDVLLYNVPDGETRRAMLAAWLPEAGDKAREKAAGETDGYSGAHIFELCQYARTIDDEDECGADKALAKALEKIAEQREIIDGVQLEGSNYTPRGKRADWFRRARKDGHRVESFAFEMCEWPTDATLTLNIPDGFLCYGKAAKYIPGNPPGGGGEGVDGTWSAPTLSSFTDRKWDDLSDAERRSIAKHYAYVSDITKFAGLHLPHHDPKSHKPVLAGVNNAKARASQVSGLGGEDLERVLAHLTAHQPKKSTWRLSVCRKCGKEIMPGYGFWFDPDVCNVCEPEIVKDYQRIITILKEHEQRQREQAKAEADQQVVEGPRFITEEELREAANETQEGNGGGQGLLGVLRRLGGMVRR